jgi:hypothetical protein
MTTVWKTLHEDSICPYRIQQIQHTPAMVVAKWLVLCLWINAQPRLEHYIPITDREQFALDSIINMGNVPLWQRENPQGIVKVYFQHSFSVSEWCDVIGSQLAGRYLLLPRLAGGIYTSVLENEIPALLEDIPAYAFLRTHTDMMKHPRMSVVGAIQRFSNDCILINGLVTVVELCRIGLPGC